MQTPRKLCQYHRIDSLNPCSAKLSRNLKLELLTQFSALNDETYLYY